MGEYFINSLFWAAFLASTVRLTIPILMGAAGEVLAERSGILNIAIEGMMLVGAFFAVLGSFYTGSPWVGMVWGIVAASIVAAIHAFISITVLADQVVSGAALNIACLGLTGFLNRLVFTASGKAPWVNRFEPVEIPILSDLPVIGKALFHQPLPVYIALLLVAALWVFLWKTTWGLKVRSVGEHPLAADTVGINVPLIRYVSTILGGAFAGFCGRVSFSRNRKFLRRADDERSRLHRTCRRHLRAVESRRGSSGKPAVWSRRRPSVESKIRGVSGPLPADAHAALCFDHSCIGVFRGSSGGPQGDLSALPTRDQIMRCFGN